MMADEKEKRILEEEINEKLCLNSHLWDVSSTAAASSSDIISISGANSSDDAPNLQISMTCFTEEANDVMLHFQIISFSRQIYVWIGCNSAKLGHLHAGAFTRPNMQPTITSLIGGGAESTGAGIAQRLVSRTGLNVILACNIPKNSPMLEAVAERLLIQKLNVLGYTKVDRNEKFFL